MLNLKYIMDYIVSNPNATLEDIVKNTYWVCAPFIQEDEHLSLVTFIVKNLKQHNKIFYIEGVD